MMQRQIQIDADALFDTIPHTYAALVHAIGLAYARQQGTAWWGDKTPMYIEHLELLHSLFPAARMIYIVRDGRDVALSLMRESWGPSNAFVCAEQWRRENEPRPIVAELKSKGLLYQLRYEDLLADPARVLGDIMAFLGIASTPATLDVQV